MASPPDEDDDGDYLIQLTPMADAPAAKNATRKLPTHTVELDTADFANMAQSGEASAKPNLVIQLESGKTVELQPGWSQEREESSIVVDDPKVIVTSPAIARIPLPKVAAPKPAAVVRPIAPQRPGLWLVVIVYVLAMTALGLAIYERFG